MSKMKEFLSKLTWYPKQLLPFTYRTKYIENGKQYFCVWRMWLGRCFDIDTYEVTKKV